MTTFKVGDEVRIAERKENRTFYWSPEMTRLLGTVDIIKQIKSNGCINLSRANWEYLPESLELVSREAPVPTIAKNFRDFVKQKQ